MSFSSGIKQFRIAIYHPITRYASTGLLSMAEVQTLIP